jgi:hypothetical protein
MHRPEKNMPVSFLTGIGYYDSSKNY